MIGADYVGEFRYLQFFRENTSTMLKARHQNRVVFGSVDVSASRFACLLGSTLGLVAATATAQPTPWLPELHERDTVASLRFVLPLDGEQSSARSFDDARLTFGLDVRSTSARTATSLRPPRLGYGLSFDGDWVYDLGHTSFTEAEMNAVLYASDPDEADSDGSAVPWIVGGVVAVGVLGAVFVAEVEDSAFDVTRCVLDPDCPTD